LGSNVSGRLTWAMTPKTVGIGAAGGGIVIIARATLDVGYQRFTRARVSRWLVVAGAGVLGSSATRGSLGQLPSVQTGDHGDESPLALVVGEAAVR